MQEEGEDGAPERAAASEAAALHVAQVVVAQAIPQANKLAAHLISHWGTVQVCWWQAAGYWWARCGLAWPLLHMRLLPSTALFTCLLPL